MNIYHGSTKFLLTLFLKLFNRQCLNNKIHPQLFNHFIKFSSNACPAPNDWKEFWCWGPYYHPCLARAYAEADEKSTSFMKCFLFTLSWPKCYYYNMSLIKTTLLLLLLLFISILFSSVFLENPYTDLHIINDFGDRFIYSQRAHWYVFDKIPYTEVFSEYPQVATYFFALPYFILQLTGANTPFQVIHGYAAIFSMLMMMFAVATIWLIHYFRKDKKYLALLLLLPVSFYFIHNRYDIIPAFLALLSLFFFHKKKFLLATIICIAPGLWF